MIEVVKLKRNYKVREYDFEEKEYKTTKEFNYYTKDKKYFIKKENKCFTLYSEYFSKLKSLPTLKEVKDLILFIEKHSSMRIYDAWSIESYIERCKNVIEYYSVLERFEVVKKIEYMLELALLFKKIATKESLIISKSPYSQSYYAHKYNDEITWDSKPELSYRFSDHWNWDDRNEVNKVHCRTIDDKDYGLTICQYRNGYYSKIEAVLNMVEMV